MPVPSDQNGAIAALEEGTRPGRPLAFKQADMLVSLDFSALAIQSTLHLIGRL